MRTFSCLLWASFCTLVILASAHGAEPPFSGTFTVNGKPGNLAFLRVVKGDEFSGQPTTVLVFTEKDASREAKPAFYAGFGKFGNSLTITVMPDGQIIGCEVCHSALPHKTFSSSGTTKMTDFKNEGGTIQGKISTGGEIEALGEKWEVNLTFKTKGP
jgi:hypothetical protein